MKEEIIKNLNNIDDEYVLSFIHEYIKSIVELTKNN